jgi:hypothetical protein
MRGNIEWIDPTKNKKLEELIIYISEKSKSDPCFGATKLNKILFVADFSYYGVSGKAITDSIYVNRKNGPTPKFMKLALDSLEKQRKIRIEKTPYFGHKQDRTIPLVEPDLSAFTESEVSFIDSIIEVLRPFNASQLSASTHTLLPWVLTKLEETIPYETIFVFDNKPVDKVGIRWAQKELETLSSK